jgi:O-acetyl-ADP-ribose deacetylase (regulator of RNase III)
MKYITSTGNLVDNNVLAQGGVIVHGCNAQGAMGSGVALAIKNKWPVVYADYRAVFNAHGLETGDVIYSDVAIHQGSRLVVANAITQEFYKGCRQAGPITDVYVDYEAITKCFEDILEFFDANPGLAQNIHMPMIGAGLGGGDWNTIEQRIHETLKDTDIHLYLWVYQ